MYTLVCVQWACAKISDDGETFQQGFKVSADTYRGLTRHILCPCAGAIYFQECRKCLLQRLQHSPSASCSQNRWVKSPIPPAPLLAPIFNLLYSSLSPSLLYVSLCSLGACLFCLITKNTLGDPQGAYINLISDA